MDSSINCLDPNFTLYALMSKCQGAYARKTLSGYSSDLRQFQTWCAGRRATWAPASPETLAAFIDNQSDRFGLATIKRRVEAIKFAHRMLDLPSPADHSAPRLAMRRAVRANPSRQSQALGLTSEMLQSILCTCPPSLAGRRDAALIATGYDTLCRSSELAAMRIEHLSHNLDSIVVPRSKADVSGKGRVTYLSPGSQARLRKWLEASELKEGPLFQGLHTRKLLGRSLDPSSIRRIIKRAAVRAKLKPESVNALSGHSMRIGAAQDMMLAGIDLIAIMQAGGWKSVNVLARYVENAAVRRIHVQRWDRLALL
jgi:site-specific recombinase XerD